ncbi:hypothetical protein [Kineosporia babensis]|uniref:Uncharacterized protein n=1 Tax=Kineosporia babensis TaxID=499548 RepID=A0A9X1NP83_9ACTN|nr:hypothetical protein [Kineosporia babensis]MCD5317104.1 hypothetical protein [Kineosporia babensis]
MTSTAVPVAALRLTRSDIAAACGVDRSTVTRWQKTQSFPRAVGQVRGTGEAALFALGDVHDWLAQERADDGVAIERLYPYAFAREVVCRHAGQPALNVVLGLLVNRESGGVQRVPEAFDWMVDHLTHGPGFTLLERLLDLRSALFGPGKAWDQLRPEAIELIAGLVQPGEGQVELHDPAAREGDLLVAVARAMAERATGTQKLLIRAHDDEPFLRTLVNLRLEGLQRDLAADGRSTTLFLRITDTDKALLGPTDRIVALLPLDSDPRSMVVALDALLKRLRPGGQLVVAGPRESMVGDLPATSDIGRRRAALLREVTLSAVLHLPGLIRGPVDRAAAVMVMHRAAVSGQTTVLDLRQQPLTSERVRTALQSIEAKALEADGQTRTIAQADLLASEFRLAATRPASPVPVEGLLEALGRSSGLKERAEELRRISQESYRPARRSPIGSRRRGQTADLQVLIPPRAGEISLAGDVVVTFEDANATSARADLEGGALVHRPNQIVRITEQGRPLWTPRVLAALITWRLGDAAAGSLDSISVAPPPAGLLNEWDKALEAIQGYRTTLGELAASLDDLERATTNAMFTGSGMPVPVNSLDD